ncbi:S-layer homology domain-containing protein [Tissierella sp. Yu-01]|uniref:S-layer homology domain-containing protein n=1 Tax=Tissierella sp. Yu-01 TaxID=3035694 RepID=UPI00240DF888|nr:S-layer homology domain-containing protein [Tissierella sp. Yu-01]WFA09869.1 S-layer homology domain-containing protein [Tissierella sp. Yu-01]
MAKEKIKAILSMLLASVIALGVMSFGGIAIASGTNSTGEDNTRPVVNYAYVEDGKLKISIYDDEELADEPIVYRIDKEYRSYEIDIDDYKNEYDGRKKVGEIYEIKVEIPSTIFITVIDHAGNESTYKFTIKEDNISLTKETPDFVLERLTENRQSEVDSFKGYDDIFELEYGKVVHALSLYDEIIDNNYRSYNRNDIKFKISGLSMDKDGNIKLDKYGIFKVTMTHNKDKTFEEAAYILIKPDWRNIEDRRIPNNVSPYIVYSDNIKIADYFRYDDEVNGSKSKSKIDTSYMLVYNEETDQTLTLNDKISLELNKPYRLSVLNFEDNSEQDFFIMRQEKTKSTNRNFSDIDKDHWASKDISSLVSKGLLSGYPDGSFNPAGNITIREFMTILSRQIAITPKNGRPVVGNVIVPIDSSSWGYIESKSILDRIPPTDLYRFNYFNIDRPITREEVTFLIDKALELGIAYNADVKNMLTDIGMSSYPLEVKKFVDLGLISGYPDGTFKPKNNITRAEIAAVFARIK